MYMYKRYRQSDAVWFDSDWPWGMQRGQGVRADGCFVILRRGLHEVGERNMVWFELETN